MLLTRVRHDAPPVDSRRIQRYCTSSMIVEPAVIGGDIFLNLASVCTYAHLIFPEVVAPSARKRSGFIEHAERQRGNLLLRYRGLLCVVRLCCLLYVPLCCVRELLLLLCVLSVYQQEQNYCSVG